MTAFLDWVTFGELPMPVWAMNPEMANELRYLASQLPKLSPLARGLV